MVIVATLVMLMSTIGCSYARNGDGAGNVDADDDILWV